MKSIWIVSTWVLSTKWWGWCRWRCLSFKSQHVKNSRPRPSLQHPCKGLHKALLLKHSQRGSNECRVLLSAKLSWPFVQKTTFPVHFLPHVAVECVWPFRFDFSPLSTPVQYFQETVECGPFPFYLPSVHVAQGDHSQEALSADCGCLHLKPQNRFFQFYTIWLSFCSIKVFTLFH